MVTKGEGREGEGWTGSLGLVSSVQLSCSVVSDTVTPWTAASQASLSFINSWSLSKLMSVESVMPSNHLILCHPLLSCLQSFPASGSFPRSQFFKSGGQSTGVSASASVLSMNSQDWFPLGLIGLILLFKGHSRVFLSTTVQKQILWCLVLVFFIFQLSYLHANWKNHSFDYMYLCWLNDVSAF